MTIHCSYSITNNNNVENNEKETQTSCNILVVGPFSADSANSHHGNFSLVQKANGMATKIRTEIEKKLSQIYKVQSIGRKHKFWRTISVIK